MRFFGILLHAPSGVIALKGLLGFLTFRFSRLKYSKISSFIEFGLAVGCLELLERLALIVSVFFSKEADVSGPKVLTVFSVERSCFLLAVPVLFGAIDEVFSFLRHCLMISQ